MAWSILDRACTRLAEATGADNFDENAIPALLHAAADPDKAGCCSATPPVSPTSAT